MPRIENNLIIKNCIQDMRLAKKMTQEELANAVNVTRATIIALEKGNYNPSLELAFRIARFFKTEIQKIFFVKGDYHE